MALFIIFNGGKEIRPLNVGDLPLVIAHSGIKAETPVMVKKVKDQYKKNRGIMDDIFGLMGEITQQAKGALENGDFQRVGELADMNQGLLEALGVSCQELSRLIYAARDSGAYGAKLSGAGGGDCMVAFVDEEVRNSVEQSLKQAGGKILDVKSNANGVRIEK